MTVMIMNLHEPLGLLLTSYDAFTFPPMTTTASNCCSVQF